MADYRTVSVSFWNDEYIETLSASERLFFLYLFTNPHVNNAGVLKITSRKIAFESGVEDVQPCIDRLIADGKLIEIDGYFWVTGFIKHQTANSPKIVSSIIKVLQRLPESLANLICDRYLRIKDAYRKTIETTKAGIDTVSVPYQHPTDEVSIPTFNSVQFNSDSNSKKKGVSESFLASPFKDEAYAFADWFATELKPESVKVNKNVRDDWALVWYHLRETDARNTDAAKEAMKGAIRWARQDPFWSKNFLTPLKLRKKDGEGVMFIDRFLEGSRTVNGITKGNRQAAVEGHRYRPMKPLSMED